MDLLIPSIAIAMWGTTILIIIYIYLYTLENKDFIGIWALSWGVFLIGLVATLFMLRSPENEKILFFVHQLSVIISSMLVIKGAYRFLEKKAESRNMVLVFSAIAWLVIGTLFNLSSFIIAVPTFTLISLVFIWFGIKVIDNWKVKTLSFYGFKLGFILWGVHLFNYPWLKSFKGFAPWGFIIATGLEFLVAINFLLMYFEKSKKDLIIIQNNLIENENKLSTIIKNQKDSIFEINNHCRFIFISESSKDIFGYNSTEMLDKFIYRYVDIDIEKYFFNNSKIYDYVETTGVTKEGNKIYLNINWKLNYNEYGIFTGAVGSIRDITNNKILEEVMEYDKFKTEFFANVSHELRTPLNVISATIQLLESYNKSSFFKENPENLTKYIKIMKQNSYRLMKLFNNLIDLTKIESGFYSLQLKNYNIVSVVEDITLSIKEYTESKGIRLEFDTEVEELIMACDSDKIERIMLNLLSNSIKFTPSGGKISVGLYEMDRHVYIKIRDTGVGIPKDKLEDIFNRFSQVHNPYVNNSNGSGIGLSIVKSLVELHEGNIAVNSDLNKGAEFVIKMPIRTIKGQQIVLNDVDTNRIGEEKVNIELSDI